MRRYITDVTGIQQQRFLSSVRRQDTANRFVLFDVGNKDKFFAVDDAARKMRRSLTVPAYRTVGQQVGNTVKRIRTDDRDAVCLDCGAFFLGQYDSGFNGNAESQIFVCKANTVTDGKAPDLAVESVKYIKIRRAVKTVPPEILGRIDQRNGIQGLSRCHHRTHFRQMVVEFSHCMGKHGFRGEIRRCKILCFSKETVMVGMRHKERNALHDLKCGNPRKRSRLNPEVGCGKHFAHRFPFAKHICRRRRLLCAHIMRYIGEVRHFQRRLRQSPHDIGKIKTFPAHMLSAIQRIQFLVGSRIIKVRTDIGKTSFRKCGTARRIVMKKR